MSTARTMYPGWRIRIYHNVTRENEEVYLSILVFMAYNFALLQVWEKFCQYFCAEDILDLCDVNSLPGMDKWNSDKPHGMFWRMQVPPKNENTNQIMLSKKGWYYKQCHYNWKQLYVGYIYVTESHEFSMFCQKFQDFPKTFKTPQVCSSYLFCPSNPENMESLKL